ncbi:MAG: GNAT family N-acetyltransferase, partial [Rhizomicrobium sp.]
SEVKAAQRLRYRVFYEEMTAIPSLAMREQRMDFDQFDAFCDHLLVIDRELIDEDGQPAVVGTTRLMRDVDAKRAGGFYTSGEYDIAQILSELGSGNLVEIGRSCILRDYRTKPSTMQLLWRGVMVYDLRFSIDLMFGCASLAGTDPNTLALPLSYLHYYYPMPEGMRVRARSELYVEMNRMPKAAIDPKAALHALPPIIKGYLRAGASIGNGAVIDRQFDTTDVFIYFPLSNMDARYRSRFARSVGL